MDDRSTGVLCATSGMLEAMRLPPGGMSMSIPRDQRSTREWPRSGPDQARRRSGCWRQSPKWCNRCLWHGRGGVRRWCAGPCGGVGSQGEHGGRHCAVGCAVADFWAVLCRIQGWKATRRGTVLQRRRGAVTTIKGEIFELRARTRAVRDSAGWGRSVWKKNKWRDGLVECDRRLTESHGSGGDGSLFWREVVMGR
jgi:hypothetical protein